MTAADDVPGSIAAGAPSSRAVGALLADAAGRLAAAGVDAPRREARLLLAYALGLDHGALLGLGADARVASARFEGLLRRRERREPFALITGRRGFWTLDLAVSAATLIPRADTETVVEAALASLPADCRRVLDLGTGTGAILLAILSERPDAFGVGVDRSEAACALARRNARTGGMSGRASFVCADWAAALGCGAAGFDLVVSNPPYVPTGAIDRLDPDVARFEPRAALDGGDDGLDAYRAIVPSVHRLLVPTGIAVLEVGAGQAEPVAAIAASASLRTVAVRTDLAGIGRAVVLRRME